MNSVFSSDWIDELKSKNDIVSVISKYVNLNKKGRYFWACCPFHFEKTASMAVDEVEQYYHCYGCGAGGDVITFIEKIENVDFYDACKILAENAGMKLPTVIKDENISERKKEREQIYNVLRDCAYIYYNNLKLPEASVAKAYIEKRRLSSATVTAWGIGCSLGWNNIISDLEKKGHSKDIMLKAGIIEEKNGKFFDAYAKRLIFPLINSFGNVVGFSARMLEDADYAKYKNTTQTSVFDKSKCVFGINMIKKAKRENNLKEIIIVEGQMDVISLYQAGVKNAVATLGTALTSFHAKEIKRFADKVVVCFDGDGAGKKATLRSLEILVNEGLDVYVASLPPGVDPDEFILKYGKDKFNLHIENSKYWVEYLIYEYKNKYNLNRANEKADFVNEVLALIKTLKSESEKNIYLDMLKNLTNISIDVLRSDLNNQNVNKEPSKIVDKSKEENLVFENAYVKAVKFIMASLLHKKAYAKMQPDILENLQNNNYKALYNHFEEYKAQNKTITVGAVYGLFEVEENEDILDLINYEFLESNENEDYFNDCVLTIKKYGIEKRLQDLKNQASEVGDLDKKREIIKEISSLILKRKELDS